MRMTLLSWGTSRIIVNLIFKLRFSTTISYKI